MIKVGLITYYFIFLLANSNKPPIRKLKKTVRWVLGIILSLYIGTILLLNIPYVQRQISVLVANELANVLGTQLTIGRINMGLLNAKSIPPFCKIRYTSLVQGQSIDQ